MSEDTIEILIRRQVGDVVREGSIECDRRAVTSNSISLIMAHVRKQLELVAADDVVIDEPGELPQRIGLHVVERPNSDDHE